MLTNGFSKAVQQELPTTPRDSAGPSSEGRRSKLKEKAGPYPVPSPWRQLPVEACNPLLMKMVMTMLTAMLAVMAVTGFMVKNLMLMEVPLVKLLAPIVLKAVFLRVLRRARLHRGPFALATARCKSTL